MASLAKELMDIFYAEERKYLAAEDYETAQAYGIGESAVNNVMHGLYDSEWVPHFVSIMRSHAEGAPTSDLAAHFELMASLAEDSLRKPQ